MKKIVTLLLLTVSLFTFKSGFAQKNNCKKFKNGTFKLVDENSGTTFIIERKGKLQIEQIKGNDLKLTFNVEWIDECTYMVTATKETLKIKPDFTYPIKVEILETKEKSYISRSTIPGIDNFSKEVEIFLTE